jgi:hypothetical protein
MLNFKVTKQTRTLSKYVQFESEFGRYQFKGSADMVKQADALRYQPVSARISVFEKTDQGSRYAGKVRMTRFSDKGEAGEVIPDIVDQAFDADELRDLLDSAPHQLHIV